MLTYATVSVRTGLGGVSPLTQAGDSSSEAEASSTEFRNSLRRITADSFSISSEDRRFAYLSRTTRGTGLFAGDEVVLFHKKLVSHFNYNSYARLDSGYGQWYNGPDPIGRTRTSGVGVRDPDWIYVKMSFFF
jgi:hypothetical protein